MALKRAVANKGRSIGTAYQREHQKQDRLPPKMKCHRGSLAFFRFLKFQAAYILGRVQRESAPAGGAAARFILLLLTGRIKTVKHTL